MGGGRSDRYDEKHAARGGGRTYLPSWSDAAAAAVMEQLKLDALAKTGQQKVKKADVAEMLAAPGGGESLVTRAGKKLTPADRGLVHAIVTAVQQEVQQAVQDGGNDKALSRVHSFLKPLRERKAARGEVGELVVPAAESGPVTFHVWLAEDPTTERQRDISNNKRITDGIAKWPLGWLHSDAVICYERAAGRVRKERPGCEGRPDAKFTRGFVKTHRLPTALANDGDHYVVISPYRPARFMTVEEVARSFMVPSESPLMRMLTDPDILSAAEAVSCLGRAVHVGVATQLVQELARRGLVHPHMRYGSAYSGVDTFAAAIEAELGEDWTYAAACELDDTVRGALLAAWGCRGLTEETCGHDAGSEEAAGLPAVDLWVITPTCESYSKRNHLRTAKVQNVALGKVWKALEYARRQRPRVIVVENVAEAGAVGPITGLMARMEGYDMEAAKLDPRTVAKAPVAREREFWVLTRRT